ncbi:hypothetical protein EUTSA_v10022056mg [Eutrema salsugineum]|uniref:Uncharacterized protein n=1 Tax=Eutrema salsugineum TaxID=72664 RepID=V4M6F0_EUTSA|nr:hypothetical protein EUTSA_v10022056mg [Eutrema salsugineum]
MDVSEEEFDSDYASGSSEGSSQGENFVDFMLSEMLADMSDDSEDVLDYAIAANSLQPETKQVLAQLWPPRSDHKPNVSDTMKVLDHLSGVRMGSPLYIASMAHIQADVIHREAFLAFRDPEDKVCYLEYKTGKKRDE